VINPAQGTVVGRIFEWSADRGITRIGKIRNPAQALARVGQTGGVAALLPDCPSDRAARGLELARQFEPSAQAIRNWVRQADRDDGRRSDGLTTEERAEGRRVSGTR